MNENISSKSLNLEIYKEQIIKLHRAGYRARAIAKQLKVSEGLIKECLVNWGEVLHPPHPKKGIKQGKKYQQIPATFLSKTKQNAEERNIKYNISPKEIWTLYLQQNGKCYLTGDILDFAQSHRLGNVSLDRIDSNKDYTFENCALATKIANKSKMEFSVSIFTELCDKVSEHNTEIYKDIL